MQVMFGSSICKRTFLAAVTTILLFLIGDVSAMDMKLKGKLAFSTQNELYVVNLDAKSSWKMPEKIPLPSKQDMAHHPSWMPGGDGIIFEYSHWADYNGQIINCLAVVDLFSKKLVPFEQHLLSRGGKVSYPRWSPNGEMLAYLEHE
jgi:Tol biopolymer transport system component